MPLLPSAPPLAHLSPPVPLAVGEVVQTFLFGLCIGVYLLTPARRASGCAVRVFLAAITSMVGHSGSPILSYDRPTQHVEHLLHGPPLHDPRIASDQGAWERHCATQGHGACGTHDSFSIHRADCDRADLLCHPGGQGAVTTSGLFHRSLSRNEQFLRGRRAKLVWLAAFVAGMVAILVGWGGAAAWFTTDYLDRRGSTETTYAVFEAHASAVGFFATAFVDILITATLVDRLRRNIVGFNSHTDSALRRVCRMTLASGSLTAAIALTNGTRPRPPSVDSLTYARQQPSFRCRTSCLVPRRSSTTSWCTLAHRSPVSPHSGRWTCARGSGDRPCRAPPSSRYRSRSGQTSRPTTRSCKIYPFVDVRTGRRLQAAPNQVRPPLRSRKAPCPPSRRDTGCPSTLVATSGAGLSSTVVEIQYPPSQSKGLSESSERRVSMQRGMPSTSARARPGPTRWRRAGAGTLGRPF